MASARAVPKQLTPWKPGQSGNPAGRPKGSRNKLAEQFVADLLEDWREHGAQAIVDVRESRPHEYLRVIASIMPKDVNVNVSAVERFGQIIEAIEAGAVRDVTPALPLVGSTDSKSMNQNHKINGSD